MYKVLVVDTETTGVCNMRLPYDTNTLKPTKVRMIFWPFLTEISCKQFNLDEESFTMTEEYNAYIKPYYDESFYSKEALEKTGITISFLRENGVDVKEAISNFIRLFDSVDFVVAHNSTFDMKIIKAEFLRQGIDLHLRTKPWIDTMWYGRTVIKNATGKTKYPKLSELYQFLTGKTPERVHDSKDDTYLTAECFKGLLREGELTLTRLQQRIDKINA